MLLKIGELAKRAGLTVRALHHYDAIGLLSPSVRTECGARRYGQQDLIRLHQIQALKALGYNLPDIRSSLNDPGIKPLEIMQHQMRVLEEQTRVARELIERLQHLSAHVCEGSATEATDWLHLLEMMTMYQNHLNEEDMQALRKPGGTAARETATQWTQLIAEVAQALQQHLPPQSPQAQALAWRWMRLVIAMTSNDPSLAVKLKAMQEKEPRAQEIMGLGPETFTWIGQAHAHARTALFAPYLSDAEAATVLQRQLVHLQDWPPLVALVRAQMLAASPVDAPAVQALMRRWQQLFRDSYCGDDLALESKVRTALVQEPDLMLGAGFDEALMVYVQRAIMVLQRPGASQSPSAQAAPKPSALLVAIQRAAHQLLDQPLVLDDPLALRMLDPLDAQTLQANPAQYQDPMSRGLRTSLVVRARLAEDAWAGAAARGVRQFVVLGAGLDTCAYRRSQLGGRIFEVDLPSTQAWKQASLQAAAIAIPDNVTFVPTDFETSTLAQTLAGHGFQADAPAFFSWLGVVMYLPESAVLDTLRFIAGCAAGSGVVFDYVVAAGALPVMLRVPLLVMAKHLEARGEPWKSYFVPAGLDQQLSTLGFSHIQNFTPDALNQRYLANRADGLRLGGLTRLVHAQV